MADHAFWAFEWSKVVFTKTTVENWTEILTG